MNNNSNSNCLLCDKVKAKGFRPTHVAEIGVWHPHTSNIYSYIIEGIKTTLVEPDPDSIKLIKSEFGHKQNVTIHEFAACDYNGQVQLCKRQSSTFVSSLPASPALVNDDCNIQQADSFTAVARLFSEIDDGTIDLLSVDTEGSEWFAIKHMISRPAVISVETHGGRYVNPYMNELRQWMADNNYCLWYKDKSDSVFVQPDSISVTFSDKINLLVANFIIAIKSHKKRLSKMLKKHS